MKNIKENVKELDKVEEKFEEQSAALQIYNQIKADNLLEKIEELSERQAIKLVARKISKSNCKLYPCDLGIGKVGLIIELTSKDVNALAM